MLKYIVAAIFIILALFMIANYFLADQTKAEYEKFYTSHAQKISNSKEVLGKVELIRPPSVQAP